MEHGKKLESLVGCILGLTAVFLIRIILLVHSPENINQAVSRMKRSLIQHSDVDEFPFQSLEFDDVVIEDPWENKNANESWASLLQDLGIKSDENSIDFTIDSENDQIGQISEAVSDVMIKQRSSRRRGPQKTVSKTNLDRFREHHVSSLHKDFEKVHKTRMNNLKFFNEMSGVTYGKNEWMLDSEEKSANRNSVKNFLDTLSCEPSGKELWSKSGGRTNIWTIFPEAVPTFGEPGKQLTDWGYYWQFFEKFSKNWSNSADIRFSLGTYGKQAKFTPRGFRHSERTPWAKIKKFYKKPSMTAATPKIFPTVRSLLTYVPRYGVSTASVGDNCVIVWFFQDVPQDLNDFMIPEQHDLIKELHSLCTVMPVIVGPEAKSDAWKNFVANFSPGLQLNVPKDEDYSGQFFVEKLEDLVKNDDLVEKMNLFQCLVENRATCRTVSDAFIVPASVMGTDEGDIEATEGFRAVLYDDSTTEPARIDLETTTGGATTPSIETADEPESVKVPEIDSCCGHDGFSATPFDSELRTCCEDGTVRAYEVDGQDPCVIFQDYFNYGNFKR